MVNRFLTLRCPTRKMKLTPDCLRELADGTRPSVKHQEVARLLPTCET